MQSTSANGLDRASSDRTAWWRAERHGAYRLNSIGVSLGETSSIICRLPGTLDQVASVRLDLREATLDKVQGRVGIVVDRLERQALLQGLKSVEYLSRQLRGSVEQCARVGVGVNDGVGLRDGVLDNGVVVGLWVRQFVSDSVHDMSECCPMLHNIKVRSRSSTKGPGKRSRFRTAVDCESPREARGDARTWASVRARTHALVGMLVLHVFSARNRSSLLLKGGRARHFVRDKRLWPTRETTTRARREEACQYG